MIVSLRRCLGTTFAQNVMVVQQRLMACMTNTSPEDTVARQGVSKSVNECILSQGILYLYSSSH